MLRSKNHNRLNSLRASPEGRIDILNNVTEFDANHAIKQELESRFFHTRSEN